MADQLSNEGSSTRNIAGDGSDAIVELNVKTIDSQRYSFQVNLNMPVSAFKEKIATETGVPVGLQRLIFRGKVLKDEHLLSEYQLENGHTLHMVVRQSTQSQSAAETSSGDANANTANRGNDANAGTPQNRIGQISHSVVLGTLNVGDSGEAVVPDFSRVIGAVLNSLGLGGQTAVSGIGGMQPSTMPTVSGQTPQGNETAGALRTDGSGQGQTGNQTQTGQTFPGQQFHSLPQFMQMPMTAAVPLPSIHSPIPDSLSTLSGFMACLDQSLAEDEPNASPNSMRDTPREELPPNVRGLQALSIVLRQAERLLGDRAVATLSHIAGRLEQEGASSDPSTRGQIQAESTYVGLAMQHLGALFLELGRTILTLQMAHPPAEASINPGPAVYISPSGPNPIMVQPFPLQTNSLFGGSAIQPNPVAVGVGNVPRNINIHIHAGTALAPVLSNVGTRTSNGEGVQGGQGNGIGSANSGPVRAIPLRNIIAVPSRATGVAVSSGAQPGIGVSVSQPPADSLVADINARIRGLLGTMQGDPPASGAVSSGAGNDARNEQSNVMVDNGAGESTVNSSGLTSDGNGQKKHDEQHDQGSNGEAKDSVLSSKDVPPCSVGCSSKETSSKSEGTSENVPSSSEKHDASENVQTIPLGLGLGSLDRKKRTKQPKPLVDGTCSTPASQNLNSGTSSQQLLQSLASHISGANSSGVNDAGAGQIPSSDGRNPEGGLWGQQNSAAGLDTAGMMSEMIQSPALNGLLAGVSEQTGVGSPNVLRDMLQQLTQNPQLMSTVGQIAQQVENQGIGNMFSGLAGGQGGGGLDLSRMMQQMMPVVSQVLGGGGSATRAFSPLESEPHQHYNEMGLERNGNVQLDLEEVAQRIGQMNTPEDIFLAVAENAVRLNGSETEFDILNELSNNDDIINEYMEVLQHDINRRLESERGQDK